MTDPLSLLRQFNINKRNIIATGDRITFGEFSFPKNIKTNYLVRPGKEENEKDYYTLESLLFLLKNTHLIHPDYVREATALNIPAVQRPVRKEVLAFLNGEIETCASIDKNVPLQKPTKQVSLPVDSDSHQNKDCNEISSDPLHLLRHYNINKKEIKEANNHILFGEVSWPKNVETNCVMWKSPKEKNVKEYYTLESLLFFLKNKDLVHPEYINQASAANIPAVGRPARKEILAFLNGDMDTCGYIDKSAPQVKPTQQVKRAHHNDMDESAAKKSRTEASHV